MKKILLGGLIAALVVGSLGLPAAAKKKKKQVKPVPTALYLHGNESIGEVEGFPFIAPEGFLVMDPTEPEGTESKSKGITNYVAGPVYDCAGNLYWPVWIGNVAGTIKGDMKLTFHARSTPGNVTVRVWPDVASQQCATQGFYPEPVGEVTVALPSGQGTVEAVIEDVDFEAASGVMIQISPERSAEAGGRPVYLPFVARVLYDATTTPSVLEFSCIPASGRSCTK
ncbi:MAG: hypothetical protein ABR575_04190 [Actinomycetota bacterium]